MKVLFLDIVHGCLQEELEASGWQCDEGTHMSRDEVFRVISAYDGIVIRSRIKVDRPLLEKAIKLKFIARSGAGMENIDLDFAQQQNILCLNAPEGNRTAVGEQALGMLLSLFNHLNRADREVRKGIWRREENRGEELEGKTVGIIGYGNMGSAFAQRLQGFGVEVLAYDKYKSGFGNSFVKETELSEIFEKCNVLSLHVPLTKETHHLVNDEFIRCFQNDFYLINTARGQVVKTESLVEGLQSGKVKGACLDVLEYEKSSFENLSKEGLPDAFDYLVNSEKVILSPHIAGWTRQSYEKLSIVLAEKIKNEFVNRD